MTVLLVNWFSYFFNVLPHKVLAEICKVSAVVFTDSSNLQIDEIVKLW